MKKEVVTCDICSAECGENYLTIFETQGGKTIARKDICFECAKKYIDASKHIKSEEA